MGNTGEAGIGAKGAGVSPGSGLHAARGGGHSAGHRGPASLSSLLLLQFRGVLKMKEIDER